MTGVIHATPENFETATSKGPVLVDFYADWCGPCQAIAPVIEELATEYKGKVAFVKVDTEKEENKQIASEYGVMSIPTLILLKDGEEIERITGFRAKDDLKSTLDSAFGLAPS